MVIERERIYWVELMDLLAKTNFDAAKKGMSRQDVT